MDLGIEGKRALLLAASGGLGFAPALAPAPEGVRGCGGRSDGARAAGAARPPACHNGGPPAGVGGRFFGRPSI